jgi:hypothetical protein
MQTVTLDGTTSGYEGQWLDDACSGHGTMTATRDGLLVLSYAGGWADNKYHGRSTTAADSTIRVGEWVQDSLSGLGVLITRKDSDSSEVFAGHFKRSKLSGLCNMLLSDGQCRSGRMARGFAYDELLQVSERRVERM